MPNFCPVPDDANNPGYDQHVLKVASNPLFKKGQDVKE
jgi:hypothetical protein